MSALEQQVVMGTFTHRTIFLPSLLDSVKQFLPQIPFIVVINDGPINANMELLRQAFLATRKRYWVFLDDDIRFLNSSIIHDAVIDLITNHYAAVGVYSTFDPHWADDGYSVEGLVVQEVGWVPGYFIMVDSKLVGDVGPDLNLPCPNTAVDTSFCVSIRAKGFRIGISPNVVYHCMKVVWFDQGAYERTNQYLHEKWGQYYFDICTKLNNVVGRIPTPVTKQQCGVIEIDWMRLVENRVRLKRWQDEHYIQRSPEYLRLNAGCGMDQREGYINLDLGKGDVHGSAISLPFEDGVFDEVSCHHVLEHLPQRYMKVALAEFYRVLKVNGCLDVGVPDIELVCKAFLLASEEDRWSWNIYTLYGSQVAHDIHPANAPREELMEYPMIHKGGVTKARLAEWLVELGFSIEDIYCYDGYETPSVFAFCRKV